jgi:hypothetical protein
MQPTVKPKQADDPHDFVVVPPDAVRVAPSDDEISDLLRAAARHHSDAQTRSVDPMAELSVPAVDATFRPTAVNDDLVPARGRSTGRRLMRALAAVMLAACIGAAAMAWQASGYAAKKLFVKWIPQFALTTSLPLDKLLGTESATSANEPEAADAAPAQAASPEQAGPEGAAANANAAAPPADSSQSLQSMARDLASVSQEVETLKASIAELKASQQQMTRDLAKASELNARAKLPVTAPHPAVANARKPPPVYSPTPTASTPAYRPTASPYSASQAAGAPAAPQVVQPYAQPYASRQVEPLPPAPPQLPPEPGFTSVPRPPMPVQ